MVSKMIIFMILLIMIITNMKNIGVIGAGNLGRHLIELLTHNRCNNFLTVSDTNINSDHNIITNIKNIEASEYIFLTVKPDQVKSVCHDIKKCHNDNVYINNHTHNLRTRKTIISSAAGVPISKIRKWLGNMSDNYNIVRMMPNIPISLGTGSIVWYSDNIRPDDKTLLCKMTKGPTSVWVNHEKKIDAATVLYGCNPAYISNYFNIYLKMGKELGFDEIENKKLLLETFKGTLGLLEDTDSETIMKEVASKGGATEKGLQILENSDFNDIIKKSTYSSLDKIKKITKDLD